MKRLIFFLLIIFCGVFLPRQTAVFLASVFSFYFRLPLELILAGFSLDSLFYTAPPALFTLGFLGMIICSEILKYLIDKDAFTGKIITISSNILIFFLIYVFS